MYQTIKGWARPSLKQHTCGNSDGDGDHIYLLASSRPFRTSSDISPSQTFPLITIERFILIKAKFKIFLIYMSKKNWHLSLPSFNNRREVLL